jgi:hypothetical protein
VQLVGDVSLWAAPLKRIDDSFGSFMGDRQRCGRYFNFTILAVGGGASIVITIECIVLVDPLRGSGLRATYLGMKTPECTILPCFLF